MEKIMRVEKIDISLCFSAILFIIISFRCLVVESAINQEGLGFLLSDISDKNTSQVEKILGKPNELVSEKITINKQKLNAQRGIYRDGKIEIVFINNGARLITINLEECGQYRKISETMSKCIKYEKYYGHYAYPKDGWTLLGELGLDKNATAQFSSEILTIWQNINGIYEIIVFNDGLDGIKYIYIVTKKEYSP